MDEEFFVRLRGDDVVIVKIWNILNTINTILSQDESGKNIKIVG